METAALIAVFFAALSVGSVSVLVFVLRYSLARMAETRGEAQRQVGAISKMLEPMSKAQNELTLHYLQLVEQVHAHELQLSGSKRPV